MHIFGCKFSLRYGHRRHGPRQEELHSLWAIVTVFQVSPGLCPLGAPSLGGAPSLRESGEEQKACVEALNPGGKPCGQTASALAVRTGLTSQSPSLCVHRPVTLGLILP